MSGERFTLDTNILIYAAVPTADRRHAVASGLVRHAARSNCVLTLQAVSEFYWAASRKRLIEPATALSLALTWLDLFESVAGSVAAVRTALGLAVVGQASYWDAMLVATAGEHGCTAIMTEDMADGTVVAGVRIVNPFGAEGLSVAAGRVLGV